MHANIGDIMVLDYHVILQDNLITVNYHPAQFGGYKHSDSGDLTIFVCPKTLHDHVIKE